MRYVPYLLYRMMRSSYLPVDKKYHVEHFTCSVCPTLFGPRDPYYEHGNDIYCSYHYSTRFASKCPGCNTAILKQFVEINRTMGSECWHPECYMIYKVCVSVPVNAKEIDRYLKVWSAKVVSHRLSGPEELPICPAEPPYAKEEGRETHSSLKKKQSRMEQRVNRIWM